MPHTTAHICTPFLHSFSSHILSPWHPQDRVEVNGARLKISNLALEDSGMYQCVAENKHGTIYSTSELRVQGRRSIPIDYWYLWLDTGHLVFCCCYCCCCSDIPQSCLLSFQFKLQTSGWILYGNWSQQPEEGRWWLSVALELPQSPACSGVVGRNCSPTAAGI